MAIFSIIAVIILTILIVRLIDNYIPKKFKSAILVGLWAIIILLAYMTFMSIYGEIQFNQEKEKRYKVVIENLKDIRDSQLAHKTVTGKFQNNWDSLVKFIENEKFTITQRRDSTIIDKISVCSFNSRVKNPKSGLLFGSIENETIPAKPIKKTIGMIIKKEISKPFFKV